MYTITKGEALGELVLSYPLLSFLQHYTLIVIRSVNLKFKYFADIFSTFKGGSIPKSVPLLPTLAYQILVWMQLLQWFEAGFDEPNTDSQ